MFEVGDVVVCVRDYPLRAMHRDTADYRAQLKIGNFYRVDGLVSDKNGKHGVTLRGLFHAPFPGWSNKLFRKLPPAEQSFTDLIRRVAKPRRELLDDMIAAMEGRRG